MLFLAIAGLWALWRGSITVTESLSLQGRPARLYGVTLLASAAATLLLSPVLEPVTPQILFENTGVRLAVNAAIVAALLVGLIFPFRRSEGA